MKLSRSGITNLIVPIGPETSWELNAEHWCAICDCRSVHSRDSASGVFFYGSGTLWKGMKAYHAGLDDFSMFFFCVCRDCLAPDDPYCRPKDPDYDSLTVENIVRKNQGSKIAAILEYRKDRLCSLTEAKNAVENAAKRLGVNHRGEGFGEPL